MQVGGGEGLYTIGRAAAGGASGRASCRNLGTNLRALWRDAEYGMILWIIAVPIKLGVGFYCFAEAYGWAGKLQQAIDYVSVIQ